MKTGFFQGISRKDREQKEIAIADELSDMQRELELVMLDFNAQEKTSTVNTKEKGASAGATNKFPEKSRRFGGRWFFGGAMVCL